MLKRHLAVIAVVLFVVSAAFADDIPFTVTTDFTTLAGQNEVILGYAPLSNTTGTDLYAMNLSVNVVAGPGTFDPIDAADNYEYGFGFFSTISANNSLNTAGFLGLYLAPVGFSGPVTLSFDISTSPDFMNNNDGPDYVVAKDSFTYPAVAVPEPGSWALLASEVASGLLWFTIRGKTRKKT
ncbi:MAG TPA: hypothetical protein VNX60_14400 [Candidatus Acidoferrum sp.]|nr:hypothetical protein [Candidatus Acidoferrum sp.]